MVNQAQAANRLRIFQMYLEHPVRLLTFDEYYLTITLKPVKE